MLFRSDTHAGRGVYDLASDEAQKTGEFRHGIGLFYGREDDVIADYLAVVGLCNEGLSGLSRYPGSPLIAQRLLRASDRIFLTELHPGENALLRDCFARARNVTIEKADGLQRMVDCVPPPERRGLVLIDPSYEVKSEYAAVASQVVRAWKKWPQGQFVIWYPLLETGLHGSLLRALRAGGVRDVLVSEIRLRTPAESSFRMRGTGLAIVNPPFGFEAALAVMTRHIADGLSKDADRSVFWLDNLPAED